MTAVTPIGSRRPVPRLSGPPPYRGKLLKAAEVRDRWFADRSVDWIHRRVPGRRAYGPRTYRWVEYDVIEYINGEVA